MSQTTKTFPIVFLSAVAAPILAIGLIGSTAVADDGNRAKEFAVIVCEDGNRFVFDQDDGVAEPEAFGLPAYGNEFITQGHILPEHALGGMDCGDFSLAEIQAMAIGEWTCRGWHVSDAATHVEGPVVITTQNFDFHYRMDDPPGKNMVVTDGLERFDFDASFNVVAVPISRPIVGGSGAFAKARGETVQELLAIGGDPLGVMLRVQFRFTDPVETPLL